MEGITKLKENMDARKIAEPTEEGNFTRIEAFAVLSVTIFVL